MGGDAPTCNKINNLSSLPIDLLSISTHLLKKNSALKHSILLKQAVFIQIYLTSGYENLLVRLNVLYHQLDAKMVV